MHHHFIDQYSCLNGFLHKMDARIKIIIFCGVVLFIVLTPACSFFPLIFYAVLVLGLIKVSRVPLSFIVSRSIFFMPFVLIVAFSIFIGAGQDRLVFLSFILAKAYLAAFSMMILMSTVCFQDFLKALEKMRCPVIFLMIFSFMYRYIYLLADEWMRMDEARGSRTIVKRRWFKIRTLANMIGCLFIRSYERGEEVYLAMRARGYEGSNKTLYRSVIKKKDVVFLAGVFVYLLSVKMLMA
jgi:cobalt/nickel transport system permease protein